MHSPRTAASFIALTLLATGCTTSLTTDPADLTRTVPSGQVYYLPRVEHLVTLDRELVKCEVDAPAKTWATVWFKREVENLRKIQDVIDIAAATRVPPTDAPPSCPGPQVAAIKRDLGAAFPRVQAHWPAGAPADCGKEPSAYEKAYHAVTISLLKDFLADPVFGQRELWEKCAADSFKLETLTAQTDLRARLRELKRCEDLLNPPGQTREPAMGELKVAMTAVVREHNLPDLEKVYSIRYTGMADTLKHTEYTIEKYPNGTLKSINAVLEDKTAEVIQGTLRGALKLAAASGGFSPAFAAVGAQAAAPAELPLTFSAWLEQEIPPLCTARTRDLLRQKAEIEAAAEKAAGAILALAKAAEEATAAASTKTTEAAKLQKDLDALPAGDPGRDALSKKIEALKAEAKALADRADKATKDQAAISKEQSGVLTKFADLRKRLTLTSTQMFDAKAGSTEQELVGAGDAAAVWFSPAGLDKHCEDKSINPPKGWLPCSSNPPIPTTLLARVASFVPPAAHNFVQVADGNSLVYREPARGLLLVCREKSCFDAGGKPAVTPENTVFVSAADFPQLGVLAKLPLDNKVFQNNSLTASFSPSGSLEKLVYKSNARAEKAAQAFEGAAGDILTFAEAKRGAKKKALETDKAEVDAETALIKAQLEREKARKELDALLNPPADAGQE